MNVFRLSYIDEFLFKETNRGAQSRCLGYRRRFKLWLGRGFDHFRKPQFQPEPQFQPSSMPSKNVWINILSGAAVIERPDLSP